MKKVLFTLLFSIVFLSLSAQDFEIVSVESLPVDMSAREEMKTDHNDHQCALLRIATQNITPEQREGFTFKPDLGSEVVDRANRNGEILLWVSPGLKYLLIMHRDWGQYELRLPDYVARIEALHTYKVTIKGTFTVAAQAQSEVSPTQQYLVFQLTPTNATLEVDDQLWSVDADGTAMKYVNFGTYTYRVRASDYYTETGKVTVDDPNNTKMVPVSLKPNFATITLQVDANAEIWVNNVKKGVRSWTGQLGSGTYKIECRMASHKTSITTMVIDADMNGQVVVLPTPVPIYGSLNIESTPNLASIFIDGEEAGKTPISLNHILVGEHEVRLGHDGFEDYITVLNITESEPYKLVVKLDHISAQRLVEKGKEYLNKAKNCGNIDCAKEFNDDAIRCFREAAETGLPEGQYWLGERLLGSDNEACIEWLQKAANQGHLDAQKFLGDIFNYGLVGYFDYSEAVSWYSKAASQGDAESQELLWRLYYLGRGVDVDYYEMAKWCKKAANQGRVESQCFLGHLYCEGLGVVKDYSEALKWFRKAADQGNGNAQVEMGNMYNHGKGVSLDYSEALKWFRKAADQGHPGGQLNLGIMYDLGHGVPENDYEAVKWYRKSAEQGEDRAQFNLGLCYYFGEGVEVDKDEASKWLHMAAKNGNEKAKSAIKEFNL